MEDSENKDEEENNDGFKNKKGNYQVQIIEDENGREEKIITDLGHGKKSVKITRINKSDQQGNLFFVKLTNLIFKLNMIDDNNIGMPLIIMRKKNLKKEKVSPRINPINLFSGN